MLIFKRTLIFLSLYDKYHQGLLRDRQALYRTSSLWMKQLHPCDEALMGVRQNPWTPTKRRGPIAAEAASPGPAVVSLPTLIGNF